MKSSVNSAGRIELVQKLANFLDSQSIPRPEKTNCERCGSKMEQRELHFWLSGTQMTWNIPLPVCPICAQPKVPKVARSN